MHDINTILSILRKNISALSEKYPINRLGLFGSRVRGDANETSDIDVLVELTRPIGLDFVSLGDELEELLQEKVDILSMNALKTSLRKSIIEEVIYV